MFNVLDTDCDPYAINYHRRCASTHVPASPRRTMCLRWSEPCTSRAHSLHRVFASPLLELVSSETHVACSSLACAGSCHVARCAPSWSSAGSRTERLRRGRSCPRARSRARLGTRFAWPMRFSPSRTRPASRFVLALAA
jgi:hypothetical protein